MANKADRLARDRPLDTTLDSHILPMLVCVSRPCVLKDQQILRKGQYLTVLSRKNVELVCGTDQKGQKFRLNSVAPSDSRHRIVEIVEQTLAKSEEEVPRLLADANFIENNHKVGYRDQVIEVGERFTFEGYSKGKGRKREALLKRQKTGLVLGLPLGDFQNKAFTFIKVYDTCTLQSLLQKYKLPIRVKFVDSGYDDSLPKGTVLLENVFVYDTILTVTVLNDTPYHRFEVYPLDSRIMVYPSNRNMPQFVRELGMENPDANCWLRYKQKLLEVEFLMHYDIYSPRYYGHVDIENAYPKMDEHLICNENNVRSAWIRKTSPSEDTDENSSSSQLLRQNAIKSGLATVPRSAVHSNRVAALDEAFVNNADHDSSSTHQHTGKGKYYTLSHQPKGVAGDSKIHTVEITLEGGVPGREETPKSGDEVTCKDLERQPRRQRSTRDPVANPLKSTRGPRQSHELSNGALSDNEGESVSREASRQPKIFQHMTRTVSTPPVQKRSGRGGRKHNLELKSLTLRRAISENAIQGDKTSTEEEADVGRSVDSASEALDSSNLEDFPLISKQKHQSHEIFEVKDSRAEKMRSTVSDSQLPDQKRDISKHKSSDSVGSPTSASRAIKSHPTKAAAGLTASLSSTGYQPVPSRPRQVASYTDAMPPSSSAVVESQLSKADVTPGTLATKSSKTQASSPDEENQGSQPIVESDLKRSGSTSAVGNGQAHEKFITRASDQATASARQRVQKQSILDVFQDDNIFEQVAISSTGRLSSDASPTRNGEASHLPNHVRKSKSESATDAGGGKDQGAHPDRLVHSLSAETHRPLVRDPESVNGNPMFYTKEVDRELASGHYTVKNVLKSKRVKLEEALSRMKQASAPQVSPRNRGYSDASGYQTNTLSNTEKSAAGNAAPTLPTTASISSGDHRRDGYHRTARSLSEDGTNFVKSSELRKYSAPDERTGDYLTPAELSESQSSGGSANSASSGHVQNRPLPAVPPPNASRNSLPVGHVYEEINYETVKGVEPDVDTARRNELESLRRIKKLNVRQVLDILKVLQMKHFREEFKKQMIDGYMLINLTEEILQTDLKLSRFQARKLFKFVHGWRPNCQNVIAESIFTVTVNLWSIDNVYNALRAIKLNSLAMFCYENQVDGPLLLDLVDQNILPSLRERHSVTISNIEVVRLKGYLHKEYSPRESAKYLQLKV